jgi:hypothetical protein
MKTTEISRELVREGYTKRVDVKSYWDSHGKAIPWKDDKVFKYPEPKKFELYRVKRLWEFETLEPREFEFLYLYIDGEQLTDIGEITCVETLKTKLKLDCCVGAG